MRKWNNVLVKPSICITSVFYTTHLLKNVLFMEDLALITALNHSVSFCKHFCKFPEKKIEMLFTSSGPSV